MEERRGRQAEQRETEQALRSVAAEGRAWVAADRAALLERLEAEEEAGYFRKMDPSKVSKGLLKKINNLITPL